MSESLEGRYLGLAQAFQLAVGDRPIVSGDEVFSLMRRSELGGDEYVGRFFATGEEHERPLR